MVDDKKFIIANRLSFIFFVLYLIPYILLPIITQNYKYLLFLFAPLIFVLALLLRLALKYLEVKPSTMSHVTQPAAMLSILLNGAASAGPAYVVAETDWGKRIEEIKRYPSFSPDWFFLVLIMTLFGNSVFCALFEPLVFEPVNYRLLLWASVSTVIFIVAGQISSTLALVYLGEKPLAARAWRTVAIVTAGLIVIIAVVTGPGALKEYKHYQEHKQLEQHLENIEKALDE